MDIRRAMQAGADRDIEARVENRREILWRNGIAGDQRKRGDVGRRFPATGDAGRLSKASAQSTTRCSRATSFWRRFSGPFSATQATPAARPAIPSTFGVPPSSKVGKLGGLGRTR